MNLIRYFATLDFRRFILWSAFLWYATIAIRSGDGDLAAWGRSFGIAVIVGSILTLNADSRPIGKYHRAAAPRPPWLTEREPADASDACIQTFPTEASRAFP
jgi:hypothetical protein